ncbi:MAG: hypothetical protein V4568_00970 [Pseudomonadota bacterium]
MNVKTKKMVQIGLHSIVLASALHVGGVEAGTIAPLDTPAASTITNTLCGVVSTTSSFAFTPSRSVGVAYTCDATSVAVNAGNIKGKNAYGGSSNGGSVKVCAATVSTTNGYSATPALTGDGCS